ncbi:hypothetical protein OEZ86_014001 [Tetradesmus obliquus]|nr:hypothetical protein OEZ86_014001 [Tetradesmus obliquus]
MASSRVALAVLCIALVASSLAPAAEARTTFPGRSLLVDLTCSAAKGLKGQCENLCKCVAEDPMYKGSGRSMGECTGPCNSCADAAQNCPANDKLPEPCQGPSGDAAVRKCIGARRLA